MLHGSDNVFDWKSKQQKVKIFEESNEILFPLPEITEVRIMKFDDTTLLLPRVIFKNHKTTMTNNN